MNQMVQTYSEEVCVAVYHSVLDSMPCAGDTAELPITIDE